MIELYFDNYFGIWVGVAINKNKILATSFAADYKKTLYQLLIFLPLKVNFSFFWIDSPLSKKIKTLIFKILNGEKIDKIPSSLDLNNLSICSKKVLETVSHIPLGYLTSYGEIAKILNTGPRFVGNILSANPFSPLVPCHRVICSDFSMGGYANGVAEKISLLNREKQGFTQNKKISINNNALNVYPVELALNKKHLIILKFSSRSFKT